MLTINSDLKIRKNLFKNRLVVPPMASQSADENGFVTEKTLEHYKRLSTSGASLIIVEYSYISKDGKSESNQLAIDSMDKTKGLRELAGSIKKSEALAGVQLVHAGAKTERKLTGFKLIGPSPISVPVKDKILETPEQASLDEIKKIKYDFLKSAKIAKNAGFDLIEIHAAHGYGINQWLSPITNHRTDNYGGCIKNRSRLLLEIVSEIRKELPHILLSVRIPGQDHLENGLTNEESIFISKKLVSLGVDIINVSSGIGGWRRPRSRNGEGYLVEDAAIIQKNINAPVIGVGGIRTRKYIENALTNNFFAFAAIGRMILKNPIEGKNILNI